MRAVAPRSLPNGWRWVITEDVCEIQLGKMLSPAAKKNLRPRRYLRNANVLWNRFDLSNLLEMDFSEAEERKFELRPGDVLVCEGGEPGRAAVWQGEVSPCLYQKALMRLRPKGNQIDPHFLVFRVWTGSLSGEFAESHARTTIAHLPAVRLARLSIPLPPLAEQTRIVRALREEIDLVERARAAAEAQLEAAKSLPSAYLRVVFEGEDSGSWPTRALGEISDIVGGVQKSPGRVPVSFHRPYLTVRNVQRGYLDQTHIERFETTPDEVARLRLKPGDILIVEGNGSLDHIGRNALFVGDGQEWIHQNHVIRVRTDEAKARSEFVSCYLNCDAGRRQMVEKAKTTSGLYTLSAGKVGALEVPVPAVLEQDQVLTSLGRRIQEAERVRLAAERQLETVRRLPASLLRRAFSGAL